MRGLRAMREARRDEAMAEANRYTVASVAQAVGVTPPTLRKWEEHPEEIRRKDAERLAEYFGCSTDDVFYLPGNHK